jgi:hypothetical protein
MVGFHVINAGQMSRRAWRLNMLLNNVSWLSTMHNHAQLQAVRSGRIQMLPTA